MAAQHRVPDPDLDDRGMRGFRWLRHIGKPGGPGVGARLDPRRGDGATAGGLPHGYELLSRLLLPACERLGPDGRAAAVRAGVEAGRACAAAHAETVEEALLCLNQLGVTCQVDGRGVVARFPALERPQQATPQVVSCLLRGLIQGALDGAGMRLRVEVDGPAASCRFTYAPLISDPTAVPSNPGSR